MVSADVSARLAWPDDADAVAAVQEAVWRDTGLLEGDAVHDRAAASQAWRALLTTPPDARVRVLVALEQTTVRGYCLVHPSHDPDPDRGADGEGGELAVDPGQRGAGHGSRLLQAAVATLRADGFVRARWWLPTTDDALRSFVTSTGWAPDGAHRELEAADGGPRTLKQVRLVTALTDA